MLIDHVEEATLAVRFFRSFSLSLSPLSPSFFFFFPLRQRSFDVFSFFSLSLALVFFSLLRDDGYPSRFFKTKAMTSQDWLGRHW
ncbi:membrane-associated protein, putative [Bodo saltans]|uniref:Membrane-associated protein, putative n=1 Tax=Bodo saltans TaxID=75058 RepID=A0A0S4KIM4_BODSA|nr:membrane-associated protein, putative [Bodo saltans]|eukprot:CUI15540.1 membrane-associated protein, putative [Bodo saltans]